MCESQRGMIQSPAPESPASDRFAAMPRPAVSRRQPRTKPRCALSAAGLVALALAGCASEQLSPGLETTILPAAIEYACDEGRVLRVERAGGATSATAIVGGARYTLPRSDSAAQEKYAQGATALYLDGDIAMLESDGRVLAGNCRSTVSLPKAPAMRPYKF